MNQLISYVRAIQGLPSPVAILEQLTTKKTWLDQGFEVQREECHYRFDNGVLIVRVVEQDQFPTELACAECWICYEAQMEQGGPTISPPRKTFSNACRESFWIKYHSA